MTHAHLHKRKRRKDTCIPHNKRNCIKCPSCKHGFYDGVGCIICDTDGAAESQGIFPTKREKLIDILENMMEDCGESPGEPYITQILDMFKTR